MPTYRKRGKRWQAMVRRKGFADVAKSFPTLGAARTWAERTEREQAERTARGATEADTMTVRDCIKWYMHPDRGNQKWGRTKEADLTRLMGYALADRIAADLKAPDYIRHIEGRRRTGAGPATAGNDLIWLRQVLRAARTGKRVPVDLQELDDASHDLRRRRIIQKSRHRDRRLDPDEEKALMAYFAARPRSTIPMCEIVQYALATARREDEITRLLRKDLRPDKGTAFIDDVKHPRQKIGNRREFRMLAEAWAIIDRQPEGDRRVFPYNPKTIGTYFTDACHVLEIENLHFHDLRHEATSRLFERGYAIHEVMQFTLHESWATLKRYTHLKPENIKEKTTPASALPVA